MAGKITIMSKVKQAIILRQKGKGRKSTARILGVSKNTVKNIFDRIDQLLQSGFTEKRLIQLPDPELEAKVFSGSPSYKENQRYEYLKEQFSYYKGELKRNGVTRQLLWEEYVQANPEGYGYSQFCHHLQKIGEASLPSLHLQHEAGDKLFVDFAGQPLSYVDRQTGEEISCQAFVACLPCSDYGYVLAVEDQSVSSLAYAVTCCLSSLGGVPACIIPDNLKSAVTRSDRYEPTIQQTMDDLANHYGTAIIPTRTYKPKDKALVENQVRLVYQRVYAKLRDQRFYSLEELNRAIAEKVLAHNQTRMQQKPHCREELFLARELPKLSPLPDEPYQIKKYKRLQVAKNNHIYLSDDKHYYSVPHTCIGQKANVLYTRKMVYIYCKGEQVAVHIRNYNLGGYTTQKDHLCSHHQAYLDRSPDYYRKRGRQMHQVIGKMTDRLFQQDRHPEQLYKTCEGIFGLYRRHNPEEVVKACEIALANEQFSYRFILNLIENKMTGEEPIDKPEGPLPKHDNVRGKSYYQTLLNFNQNQL